MVDKWTVIERFALGKKMRSDDWILAVYRKASALVKEYKVKCEDDASEGAMREMADRVWMAGRKMAAEMGIYMLENGRIAKFDEDEIMRHFIHIPSKIIVGDGMERRVLQKRHVDGFEPYLIGAGGQCPSTMDVAIKNWRAQLALPCTDMVEGFNLPFIGPWKDERYRSAGQPQEILATYYQVSGIRKVLKDVGKPGLCYLYYPQSKKPATHLAALNPEWGIRRTDMMRAMGAVGIMTIENAWLSIAFGVQNYGCILESWSSSTTDFAGSVENTVLTAVAGTLLSFITFGGNVGGLGALPGRAAYGGAGHGRPIPAENRWINKTLQIIRDKYFPMPSWTLIQSMYEPDNPMRWLTEAVATMRLISGGISCMTIYRGEPPLRPNLITPLDLQICADVAKAVNKNRVTQAEVREIVRKLLPKEVAKGVPTNFRGMPAHEHGSYRTGKPFEELYDMTKFIPTPKPEFVKHYQEAKRKIKDAGLPLE